MRPVSRNGSLTLIYFSWRSQQFSSNSNAVFSAHLPQSGRGCWAYFKTASALILVSQSARNAQGNFAETIRTLTNFSLLKGGGNFRVWISWKTYNWKRGDSLWVFIYVFRGLFTIISLWQIYHLNPLSYLMGVLLVHCWNIIVISICKLRPKTNNLFSIYLSVFLLLRHWLIQSL